MKRVYSGLMLILLILYIMTGCGMVRIVLPSDDEGLMQENDMTDDQVEIPQDNTTKYDTEPPAPKKGGSLSVPIPRPDTLNPLLTQSKELLSFYELIYDGMFSYDRSMKPVPALVDEWVTSEDGRTWTFYLKKGIKWHNGTELTAEDVKFTLEVLRDSPNAFNGFYGQSLFKNADIASFDIAENDPYAVVITLNQPAVNLCSLMTFPILPKAVYQSIGFVANNRKEMNLEFLVGTGPYRVDLEGSDQENYIRLVRNTQWWGSEPYIDSIVAKIYKDNEEERIAFQNGEVDLLDTHVIFAENYADGENTRLYRYLTQNYDFIGINFRKNTVLQDRKIREAIAYGLDRKDIISKVYYNNALAVDVPVPSDSWLYEAGSRIYDYQPDKASAILTEAGWSDLNEDGILDRMDGDVLTELSFSLIADEDDNIRKEVAKLIQEQLGIIGIKVELQFMPREKMNEALMGGDFDAVVAGYYLDLSGNLYFAFHSSQIGNEFNNFIGYSNPKLDELLDRARATADSQELVTIYKDIQNHLVKELPYISLYFRTNSLIVRNKVKGLDSPREMHIYSDIEQWYLAE